MVRRIIGRMEMARPLQAHRLLLLLITASCVACRGYKETASESAQLYRSVFEKDSVGRSLFSFQLDTGKQSWRFYSDSSFLYHPETGLVARSGWLWNQEEVFQKRWTQVREDSIKAKVGEEAQVLLHEEKTEATYPTSRMIVLVVLLGAASWLVLRWSLLRFFSSN